MSNQKQNNRPRGPMGHGMRGGEKAKDFKGTMKKLLNYIKPFKFSFLIGGLCCLLPCNVFKPSVFFVVENRRRHLYHFIQIDNQEYGDHREMEIKRGKEADGNSECPHGYGVADQSKLRVAAGRENAGNGCHVDGFRNHIAGTEDQHPFQIFRGLRT